MRYQMRIYVLLLLLLLPGWITGTTHIVKLDGSGDYTSIQAAINVSVPGDTVLAYPGRYYENLIIQSNGITLHSLEAVNGYPAYIDSTIVDANMISTALTIGLNVQNIAVRGFSFTNGKGTGVAIGQSSVVLTNCKIFGCIGRNGGGLVIAGSPVTLSGVEIYSNYAVYLGGGLYASAATNFQNNIIFDPIHLCSIYNNRSGAGQDIYIQNAESNLNVYLDTFSVAVPTTYYAIYLSEGLTEYQLSIDILNANHQEIDSDFYVSPDGDDANDGLSPATALRTIHEGIYRIAADSLDQKTVHLLPGTYSRTANNQIFPIALKSWTIVKGSGINNTSVTGELNPLISVGANPHNDVFMSSYQRSVSLSDISISTMNSANDTAVFGNSFGSMNLSQIHISNVNTDDLSAIWLYLSSAYESAWDSVTIENIITPDMGLVDIGGSMKGKISNCKFRNATSTYTSASVWAYPLVSFRGDQYLIFENCEFSNLNMLDDDSHAIQVGGVQLPQQHNNFTFNNCLFDNISSQGGIMVAASSNYPNISLTNCTFADNESDSYTIEVNGNVKITNCVFDNETPYQIKINPMTGLGETTTLNIDYSCIKDGMAGIQQAAGNTINYATTNTDNEPLFRGGNDPADPLNYSLSALSPCINTGSPDITELNLPPYDLAGNWRVWEDRIDIGCYEYGSEPYVDIDDPELPSPPDEFHVSVYPNPLLNTSKSAGVFIEFTLPKKPALQPKIGIYNIRGQKVKTLPLSDSYNGLVRKAGLSGDVKQNGEFYSTVWNGRDDNNKILASGTYIVRVSADNLTSTSKLTLLK
jgi:hypothetical protein